MPSSWEHLQCLTVAWGLQWSGCAELKSSEFYQQVRALTHLRWKEQAAVFLATL